MNREIKFRAWLTSGHGITYLNGSHMEYNIILKNGKYASVESGWDIQGVYDYPVMQYTGLKDKNGKEIYEGDVLKVYKPNTYIKANDLHEVRWHKSKSCFAYFNLRCNFFDEGRSGLITVGENQHGRWCEIIGNIYENPELLK